MLYKFVILYSAMCILHNRNKISIHNAINPPKKPKMQALIDEIINDSSLVKPHDKMKILPRKKLVLPVAQEKTRPPETVVAAVLQETAPPSSLTPTEEEKVYPKESPRRTKGDIVRYSDEDSDDETSDKASTDNNSDDESKDNDVESEIAASYHRLGKRLRKLWKEFVRRETGTSKRDSLYTQ